jgi:hypothetical protein
MDLQNGIKYPVRVYCLSVIEMIIGYSYYVNVGPFYCVKVGYTGANTHNIILTTLEEYHLIQRTVEEQYFLEILYLHTEETPAYQRNIYTITYIGYAPKNQKYISYILLLPVYS